jgi:ssDNA-binding Zn-finger/Zn-ribbon topoisomerase 1
MAIYAEGIMADGTCILRDGEKMTISEIIAELNDAAGNATCDACGHWMAPGEPNVGIGCNLHPECAGNFSQAP